MRLFGVWMGALLLGLALPAGAETVYRSVNADGQVTYSDTPPPDAESSEAVNLLAPVSEERRKAAEARQQKLIDLVSRHEEDKEEEVDREAAVAEAEQAVQDARTRVEEAKAIRRSDWWNGPGSGQLKPGYQERVSQAEQELEKAERNLQLVRSGQK